MNQVHIALRALILVIGLVGYSQPSVAEIRVAFLEARFEDGTRVELESGGRFYSVAIEFNGGWLFSEPPDGVVWSPSLHAIGAKHVATLIRSDAEPLDWFSVFSLVKTPDSESYKEWMLHVQRRYDVDFILGVPYDHGFNWNSDRSFYCSELVGKLLKLTPGPMSFSGNHWSVGSLADRRKGELGLSPDDVYAALLERGYHLEPVESCRETLE